MYALLGAMASLGGVTRMTSKFYIYIYIYNTYIIKNTIIIYKKKKKKNCIIMIFMIALSI